MASGSPPEGPKPKSAIPPHVLNGSSPLHLSSGARAARERESLNSSILSSFSPRIPAEFASSETETQSAGDSNGINANREDQNGPTPAVRSSGSSRYVAGGLSIAFEKLTSKFQTYSERPTARSKR